MLDSLLEHGGKHFAKQPFAKFYKQVYNIASSMKKTLYPLNEIKKLYLEEQLPSNLIAEKLGISRTSVQRRLHDLGVMRTAAETYKIGVIKGRIKLSGCAKFHPDLNSNSIAEMYTLGKKSAKEIAERFGTSHATIVCRLRKLGIQLRDRSEARQLAYKTGRWQPANLREDRIKDNQGYILVRVEGKRKREHILVWEQSHGHLPKGWIIHHINGKRDDNRLENLMAMPKKNHTPYLLLQAVQKRLRHVEAKLAAIEGQKEFNVQ